ncbi:MAG: 4-hydroxy-tetrahydrodipicolinate reductase [Eubacteriales bacterium]
MKILLSGCNGGMGQVLQGVISNESDMVVAAGFDRLTNENTSFPVYTHLSDCTEDIDVIIDFSHYSTFEPILTFALEKKIPLVMATTGLTSENENALRRVSKNIPVFRTANMSVGINVLLDLVAQAAKQLKEFDIEIVEKHHNKKADSPSGTALMFAQEINAALNDNLNFTYGREGKSTKRTEHELGIHAIRGGTISGEHTVIYAGEDEIIEIKHTATSKKVFAKGAVKAARYIADKKNGFYDMRKILNQD